MERAVFIPAFFRQVKASLFSGGRRLHFISGAGISLLMRRSCAVVLFMLFVFAACPVHAADEAQAAAKPPEPQTLSVPFGFYNDSFGVAAGYVYGGTGYPQPQATLLATLIAGSNSALAFYLISRDVIVPGTDRLFLDTDLAASTFGTIRSYVSGNPDFPNERAGSNDSDADNYVDGDGDDNLVRVNFRYLLPIGSGRVIPGLPNLERGLPVKGSGGGISWNPLVSGKTFVEVKPYWREQTIDSDDGNIEQKTNGAAFSLYQDNTDFVRNPSEGSTVRLRYTQDWGWFDSSRPYTVGDFEYSLYVPLGSSEKYRQKVLAFDFWTANSFSWDRTSFEDGEEVFQRPPAYLGATLGGLWRMRGYPTSRFNDQAAVYYAVEYRLIPEWNPFTKMEWLQKRVGVQWWQWVAFVEAGRVAPQWAVDELHSDVKFDAGVGVRAMAKGVVVRLDIAGSDEGFGVNMIVGQPFQF